MKDFYGELLTHGGDIYSPRETEKELVDFSANINPFGIPASVREAAVESLEACAAYPDPLCRSLRGALGEFHGLPPEYFVCGNGAADVIFRLVLAVKPGKAGVIAPTFSEYESALRCLDVPVDYLRLREERDFTPGRELLEEIDNSLDLLFFCNPNNPTGIAVKREYVRNLAEKCRECGCLLVVDECFSSFLQEEAEVTAVSLAHEFPNLFLLKAFTKMYAMAGIRLGYGICSDTRLLRRVMGCGQPWAVSTVASRCGIAALKEREFVARTVEYVAQERAFLQESLRRLGFRVFGSRANYVFFRDMRGGKRHLGELLEKEGVLIRSCSNYPGLDGSYYRVAVKNREDNRRLIRALEALCREEAEKTKHA